MENIINSIKTLFQTYGFKATSIILLTIFIVNLIKKPIVRFSEKYAIKYQCDKSIITRYISFLPFIISFIISFLWELIIVNFDFAIIDYSILATNALMYAGLAIATFETLKLQFEAYAAKKSVQKEKLTNSIEKITENKEKYNNITNEIL